ncbi:autotransporter domain-containing protein [Pseudomonas sp. URMO17WK12:I4]|uniref:autotransporter outer membrane beta-barrel domain-containing protein n=1 Tax=Pseudomonas sp. URMO17WK12:I4 TaxID=1283292 RepID=UPI0009DE05CB|nr:autotransporter outer membrane beta-barrel domain-containing protein [Pseudomonas sp. URMO17WK12:I4]
MFPIFSFKKCALACALSTAVLQSAFAAPAFYTFSIDSSNATTGTWSRPGENGNFNYASVYFTPTLDVTGIKFGQSEAGVDTWMFVYEGTFDPNSPDGPLADNDDTPITAHQTILGSDAVISCGSATLCPQVTLDVSAGKVYSIVITTYNPDAPLTSGGVLNMTFYTTGDGVFYSAPPVVPGAGGVFDSASQLSNSPALNAARVIDATPELLALFAGLDGQQRSEAASQTLPLVLGATTSAISNSLSMINNVIQARQDSTSGLSSGDVALGGEHFWIKTFGSWASQDARNGVSGFDADSKGMALGFDAAVSESTRLGLAFAYVKTDVDGDSRIAPQSAQIDTYQLIGYGTHSLSADTRLNFQVDVGQNRTEGRRQIQFTGDTAKADYDGYNVHLGLGIDHDLRLTEQLTFVPSARVDYTWIGEDSYREKGAGLLNLEVDDRDTEALVFSLDGKLDYSLTDTTILSANLGGGYDAINESASMTSVYAGAPGAAFRTDGLDLEPWLARAGLGLSHTLGNGTEVSLRYDAEARSGFTNQGAQVKARWAF